MLTSQGGDMSTNFYGCKIEKRGSDSSDQIDATELLATSLKLQKDGGKMPDKAYPPVLVLITDGYPTDDWESGLKELNKEFWAKNAVRLAFALEGADREVLEAFIGDVVNREKMIIEVTDLSKLATEIKANTTTYGMEKVRDRMPPGY